MLKRKSTLTDFRDAILRSYRLRRPILICGGVLLSCVLALIPKCVNATTNIVQGSSYKARLNTYCATSNVDSVRVISSTGSTSTSDLCGHNVSGSHRFYITLNGDGSITDSSGWTTQRVRLSDPSIEFSLPNGSGLSSAITQVSSYIPTNAIDGTTYYSSNDDTNFTNIALAYIVSDFSSTSGFTPIIDFNKFIIQNNNGTTPSSSVKAERVKKLTEDTYNHSTYGCNPDILNPDFHYNNFIIDSVINALRQIYLTDGDSVGSNLCVYSAYIPHYTDFKWGITSVNGGNTEILITTYPINGFVYPTTLSSDGWVPAMIVNPNYTKINADSGQISTYRALQAYSFGSPTLILGYCSDDDTSCKSSMNIGQQNAFNSHSEVQAVDSGNPGLAWFNVFGFHIFFPFQFLFNSFSQNACVDIPIIGSWLHLGSNAQYCQWWSSDIRNTLTPVFMLISSMILFGFIMSWLRDSDAMHDSRKEF